VGTELPGRLLRLLSLLEGRREWSGVELADRLGVTTRTVRRDVDRLRRLGYPVVGTTGGAGGYRLASGRNLPPLLLDDDEAVALAVGLRTAASSGVAGIDEAAVRALAKLERVLPPRLRSQVSSVGEVTAGLPIQGVAPVDPALLATLAAACRDHELVVFDYRRRDGRVSSRRVEPYHLVATYGRWHLLGYDVRREGWRTFRLDRLTDPVPVRHRFRPRRLPDPDPAGYVARSITHAPYRFTGTARLAAPAEMVLARLPAPVPGKVAARDEGGCTVRLGADLVRLVVADVVALLCEEPGEGAVEVELDAPAELLDQLDAVAHRLLATTRRAREDAVRRT
jgi:predicted DNA-binding transcriptional regulator YafY